MNRGAEMQPLFNILARERIGRAKSVPENNYQKIYAEILQNMILEIEDITAKGDSYQ